MNPLDNVLYFNNDIDVRLAPKNAHQTLLCFYLSYIRDSSNIYYAHDLKVDKNFLDITYRLSEYDKSGIRVLKEGSFNDFPFRKDSFRIAVKRDPVDRFLSAFNQLKVQSTHPPAIKNTWGEIQHKHFDNIDSVISLIEDDVLFDLHFLSQTKWLGSSKQYNKVYYSKDVNSLLSFLHRKTKSKVSEKDINEITINKGKYHDTVLTYNQKSRIMKLYEDDYENGWY